jgi:hypothetical protein
MDPGRSNLANFPQNSSASLLWLVVESCRGGSTGQGRPSGAGSRDGLGGVESRARIEEHLDADKQPPLSLAPRLTQPQQTGFNTVTSKHVTSTWPPAGATSMATRSTREAQQTGFNTVTSKHVTSTWPPAGATSMATRSTREANSQKTIYQGSYKTKTKTPSRCV